MRSILALFVLSVTAHATELPAPITDADYAFVRLDEARLGQLLFYDPILSGINTRMLTVKIFALMGALCALAAVVASARLANHSNDIGTLDELRVIAAAVIGGTALSGGIGTIYGAILGALIMQSLQSGMAMVGVDAPLQNIVVGAVLVLAVFVDIQYRKRLGGK